MATTSKQRASMKASRPDGTPPLSYQHFWPMVEGDVTLKVQLVCKTLMNV